MLGTAPRATIVLPVASLVCHPTDAGILMERAQTTIMKRPLARWRHRGTRTPTPTLRRILAPVLRVGPYWRPLNLGLLVGFGLLVVGFGIHDRSRPVGLGRGCVPRRLSDPYALNLGDLGAFLYFPAFAQIVGSVARLMPLEWFLAAWTFGAVAVLGLLGGRWAALFLLLPPVMVERMVGNIHLLLALAVVAGFRWPATWAFVLLTKVTPGVGLAWFVARRDWRSLSIALGATAAIAAVSFVLAPDLWRQWIDLLLNQASRPALERPGVIVLGPLWARLLAAIVLAYVGGLLGYRWPVLVATALAMPAIWVTTPAMFVALAPLVAMDRRHPLPSIGPRLSTPRWMLARANRRSARVRPMPPA